MQHDRHAIEVEVEVEVEVVHAECGRVRIRSYRVPAGTRVGQLLHLAAADSEFDGLQLDPAAVGVHGRLASTEQVLEQGDRLELYRPLAADPKQARRTRAKAARPRR